MKEIKSIQQKAIEKIGKEVQHKYNRRWELGGGTRTTTKNYNPCRHSQRLKKKEK